MGGTTGSRSWNGKAGVITTITSVLVGTAALAAIGSTVVIPGVLRAAQRDAQELLDRHEQQRTREADQRDSAILRTLEDIRSRIVRIEEKVGK